MRGCRLGLADAQDDEVGAALFRRVENRFGRFTLRDHRLEIAPGLRFGRDECLHFALERFGRPPGLEWSRHLGRYDMEHREVSGVLEREGDRILGRLERRGGQVSGIENAPQGELLDS